MRGQAAARTLHVVPEYPRSSRTRSKRPPRRAGQVALQRVLDLAYDWGSEFKTGDYEHGWKAFAARKMGLEPYTLHQLLNESYQGGVGLTVLVRVARACRCPLDWFLEEPT